MSLIHSCTLQPQGPSGLAAVRFTQPVRVSSLRIFPKGARPFAHVPDLLAETEPEAFYLNVFFNAQPIQLNLKDKQRAANALVPTTISYPGGLVDFTVDMGTEYATRLMIVKGKFERLSMAIYGQVVTDLPLIQTYEPRSIVPPEPLPLSKALDPSRSADPSLLAKDLLKLVPDAPSLASVIRLMFCLKPTDEDWDHPDFPFLYADLEDESEDYDLASVVQTLNRPVPEDVSPETLSRFVERLHEFVGPANVEQAYQIANVLNISASQYPQFGQALFSSIDFASIFDTTTLPDTATLHCLLGAASNGSVARYILQQTNMLAAIDEVYVDTRTDSNVKPALDRLRTRISSWAAFEDALSNAQGNFKKSAALIQEIGQDELSLGNWLESMIIQEDLVAKLRENPVFSSDPAPPPTLFQAINRSVSHDEFIAFVRAFVGVASVLGVLAWADSVGNDHCRERTLAVLHLWQGVRGYREIVNHLFLLRQLTRRLKWITTDNNPPRKSGLLAEKILCNLAADPYAILNQELIDTILALEQPLSHISEGERLLMRKLALVADDGLSAAVEELSFNSDRPFSLRRLKTIRVSIALITRELVENEEADWSILEAFWNEYSYGFMGRLTELFCDLSDDLIQHFVLGHDTKMNQSIVEQLFSASQELLILIDRLSPLFPLMARALRQLTAAVANIFACTDEADSVFSQNSPACTAAQQMRHICLDLMRHFSDPSFCVEPEKLGAEVILRTLLEHGQACGGRDPVLHLSQVFSLIDHILPMDGEGREHGHWVTSVFPNVLQDIKIFLKLLAVEDQVHLIRRLTVLDKGMIGIGEWLLIEELKDLREALKILAVLGDSLSEHEDNYHRNHHLAHQHRVYLKVQLLWMLSTPTASSSVWFFSTIAGTSELSLLVGEILMSLLDGCYTTPSLVNIIRLFAAHLTDFTPDTRFAVLLSTLRLAQSDPTSPASADHIVGMLQDIPATALLVDPLRLELGRLCAICAEYTTAISAEVAEMVLAMLEWLQGQSQSKLKILRGITLESFTTLCDSLASMLPQGKEAVIASVRTSITIDEDQDSIPIPVELPPTMMLSLEDIEVLLNSEAYRLSSRPSTPKGTKTPDILGTIISPPTALLRSPAATGLTKTYMNNDFRQLRQVPSARLNTSRLPSTHVDDFEGGTTSGTSISPLIVPIPMPDVSALGGLLNMC